MPSFSTSTLMRPPSANLLAAILRPVTICTAQTRASSTGQNVTLLDKLHRKQKAAIRQERLASIERAKSNPLLKSRPPTVPAETDLPSDPPLSPPYTITRTKPGHQLPIYNLSKNGGNKHLTKIRKISGDLNAMKEDLTKALGLEEGIRNQRGGKVEGASVNWQTNHIIVRGWRGPEIKAWAESMGF